MKKTLLSLGTLAALSLASCGSKDDASADPNVLVDTNFDTMAGWIPAAQRVTLSRDQAHSGHYALMVDGSNEYSLGYHALLGQLHPTRIKKIKVAAWVYVTEAGSKASLVTTVGNPAAPDEKPLLWEALEIGNDPVFGKWVEVSKVITLPESTGPANSLGFYLWRTGGDKPVYLDDLRVTAEN